MTTVSKGDIIVGDGKGGADFKAVGADGTYLKADAASAMGVTWATPGGTGDVTGPASSTDHAIAKFNGTGGKTLENSLVTVADTTGSITIGNASGALIIDGNTAIVKPDGSTTKYARADGTWATVSGSGDVLGPATSTDHSIARFNGTDNKTIQGSSVLIDDSNNVTSMGTLGCGAITSTGKLTVSVASQPIALTG